MSDPLLISQLSIAVITAAFASAKFIRYLRNVEFKRLRNYFRSFLKRRFRVFGYIISLLIDLLLMLIWTAVLYATNNLLLNNLSPELNASPLIFLKIVFTVSTIIPVVLFIVSDIFHVLGYHKHSREKTP